MPSEHPSTAARQHPSTLLDKVWDAHVVRVLDDGRSLLYIDRHLVHEVTSPQAFEGLRLAGRKVRRPDLTFATVDHNVPTAGRDRPIADPLARALRREGYEVEVCTDGEAALALALGRHRSR